MPIYSLSYTYPYYALLLLFIVLAFIEFRCLKYETDTRYVRWATMLVFLLFFGLRGFVYTDWLVYYNMFNGLPTFWSGDLGGALSSDFTQEFVTDVSMDQAGLELGFIYSTVLFKSFIPDYYLWVFCSVLIDVLIINQFVKRYSEYYVLSFIFFLVFGGVAIEMNLMRNVKALMLFLLSLKYLEERRLLPYILLNAIGLTFHVSAIFFFPLYFILNKEWPKWLTWSIFILGNILFLSHLNYIKPVVLGITDLLGGRMAIKAKLYFESELYSKAIGFGMGYFERIGTFILLMIMQRRLINKRPSNIIFINAYICFFFIYFFFYEIMIAIERMALLFSFSYWIIYPALFGELKRIRQKLMAYVLLVVYSLLIIYKDNKSVFSRYDNLLFGIQSYEDRKQIMDENLDLVLFKDEKK